MEMTKIEGGLEENQQEHGAVSNSTESTCQTNNLAQIENNLYNANSYHTIGRGHQHHHMPSILPSSLNWHGGIGESGQGPSNYVNYGPNHTQNYQNYITNDRSDITTPKLQLENSSTDSLLTVDKLSKDVRNNESIQQSTSLYPELQQAQSLQAQFEANLANAAALSHGLSHLDTGGKKQESDVRIFFRLDFLVMFLSGHN